MFDVEQPALVLGSTQSDAVVDLEATRAAGVEVVHRRSGGGAVLLEPAETLWIDILVPRDDPLWNEDVGVATHWLGDAWVRALAIDSAVVNTGAMVCRPWSGLVCFGGLGPGEVSAGQEGPKLVGISQRRTRHGARFQCAVLRRWDPVGIVGLLALSPDDREAAIAALAVAAEGVGDAVDDLAERLVATLPG